jgi:hypothetical protein
VSLTQREIHLEIQECSPECPTCGSTKPHDERDCVPPCGNCGVGGHQASECPFCKDCMEDPCGCVRTLHEDYDLPDWCEYCGLYCDGMCFWHDEDEVY